MFRFLKFTGGALAATLIASPALACTCPPEESAASQAEKADLIAVARAGAREDVGSTPWGGADYILTSFTVVELLKGEAGGEVTVRSNVPGIPQCGITWREGDEVLLLAIRSEDGGYSAWTCSQAQFPAADFRTALGEEPK